MQTIGDVFSCTRFGRDYLRRALAICDTVLLDFAPSPPAPPVGESTPSPARMYTLREHFLHIADVGDMEVYDAMEGVDMPDERWRVLHSSAGEWTLSGAWPDPASVLQELETSWRYQDEHIFNQPVELIGEPAGKAARHSFGQIAAHLLFHESQHRGQVLTYLRLAGRRPPAWG